MWSFGAELDNPVASFILSADCTESGYAGWACDKQLEALKEQWMLKPTRPSAAPSSSRDRAQAEQLVPIVPLGIARRLSHEPLGRRCHAGAGFLEYPKALMRRAVAT